MIVISEAENPINETKTILKDVTQKIFLEVEKILSEDLKSMQYF